VSAIGWLARLPLRLLQLEARWAAKPGPALLVALALGLAVATVAFGPTVRARWAPIDDHEIAWFLGPDRRLPVAEAIPMLLATEAGAPGQGSRYRPAYFTLRIGETVLWGAHPGGWYRARLAMLATFVAALLFVLRRGASVVENLALVSVVVGAIYWIDIFARLGPAEAYGVLGCGLLAIGCYRALHAQPGFLTGFLLCFGGMAAIGSKENFLVLLAPTAFVAWRARRSPSVMIAALLTIAFGLFVAVATYLGIRHHGHVYAEDVSQGGRLAVLLQGAGALLRRGAPYLAGATALTALVAGTLYARNRRSELAALGRDVRNAALAVGLLGLLYLSQLVFYNGKWPVGDMRYDFPGVMALPLIAYTGYRLAVNACAHLGLATLAAWARLALAAIVLAGAPGRLAPLRQAATEQARMTREFTQDLGKVAAASRREPTWPLVFVSHNLWDLEVVISIQRFLRFLGVECPVYLTLSGYRPEDFPEGSLEHRVAFSTAALAREGGNREGADPSMIRPWAEFPGGPCYAVGFNGEPAVPGCTSLGRLRGDVSLTR
jgi:hypothetical protein